MTIRTSVMIWLATNALAFYAGAETFAFDGLFESSDAPGCIPVEFEVAEGTGSIHVAYAYASEGNENPVMGNVVDIAIYDTQAFRGATGSAKSSFVVALTQEDTTDGYVPGPIPSGTWAVELCAAFVASGSTTAWELDIETIAGSATPFTPPAWEPPVLGGPGWYRGDLHTHSTHSDGSRPIEDVFAFAHQGGLDFIAISDHNTHTGHYEMPQLQSQYDDMALLRGIELTTYRGHANVFALTEPLDYHVTDEGYDINAVIDGVHDAGGLFSVNHPEHFSAETDGGTVSIGWTLDETDWSRVDFIEVANGASTWLGDVVNPLNANALLLWDRLLSDGHRISAVGGSDDHHAGQGDAAESFYYSPIGTPTTVVYAEELSESGVLAALLAGHAYIKAESPDGPELLLTATCGDDAGMMGDEVSGPSCDVTAEASGAAGLTLVLLGDGEEIEDEYLFDDEVVRSFEVVPSDRTVVRLELRDDDLLIALTNPVYLSWSEGAGEPSGDDDSGDDNEADGCACSAHPSPARSLAGCVLLLLLGVSRRRS